MNRQAVLVLVLEDNTVSEAVGPFDDEAHATDFEMDNCRELLKRCAYIYTVELLPPAEVM